MKAFPPPIFESDKYSNDYCLTYIYCDEICTTYGEAHVDTSKRSELNESLCDR